MSASQTFFALPTLPAHKISSAIALPYFENGPGRLGIESCVAIGAIYDQLHARLKRTDEITLQQAIFCSELVGFTWAANTNVRVANHLTHATHDYNWHRATDNPDLTGDIAILCFIPETGHSTREISIPSRFVSPHGNHPHDWRASIEKRRPKCVLSVQSAKNPEEIIAPVIRPEGYTDLPAFPFEVIRSYPLSNMQPNSGTAWKNLLPLGAHRFNMHGIIRDDIAQALAPSLATAKQNYRLQHYPIS